MSRDRLVLVTRNEHKLAELRPLFDEYGVSFDTTDLEKSEIRSQSVEEIALNAARHAHEVLKKPVVVDDTGFFISALNDFPGSYAAYVLQTIGYQGILKLLEGTQNRDARFVTAVAFCNENTLKSFIGEMLGKTDVAASGTGGFGYDPIFIPDGFSKTYAQLSLPEKVKISHRTKAFRAFLEWWTDRPENP
jgi:XTP/dITP diphosphohydrolase